MVIQTDYVSKDVCQNYSDTTYYLIEWLYQIKKCRFHWKLVLCEGVERLKYKKRVQKEQVSVLTNCLLATKEVSEFNNYSK